MTPRIVTQLMDAGRTIAVGVEFNGKRMAVRVDNPLWEEIDAEWRRTRSKI